MLHEKPINFDLTGFCHVIMAEIEKSVPTIKKIIHFSSRWDKPFVDIFKNGGAIWSLRKKIFKKNASFTKKTV